MQKQELNYLMTFGCLKHDYNIAFIKSDLSCILCFTVRLLDLFQYTYKLL